MISISAVEVCKRACVGALCQFMLTDVIWMGLSDIKGGTAKRIKIEVQLEHMHGAQRREVSKFIMRKKRETGDIHVGPVCEVCLGFQGLSGDVPFLGIIDASRWDLRSSCGCKSDLIIIIRLGRGNKDISGVMGQIDHHGPGNLFLRRVPGAGVHAAEFLP